MIEVKKNASYTKKYCIIIRRANYIYTIVIYSRFILKLPYLAVADMNLL